MTFQCQMPIHAWILSQQSMIFLKAYRHLTLTVIFIKLLFSFWIWCELRMEPTQTWSSCVFYRVRHQWKWILMELLEPKMESTRVIQKWKDTSKQQYQKYLRIKWQIIHFKIIQTFVCPEKFDVLSSKMVCG